MKFKNTNVHNLKCLNIISCNFSYNIVTKVNKKEVTKSIAASEDLSIVTIN
jgi:hypothetical protein